MKRLFILMLSNICTVSCAFNGFRAEYPAFVCAEHPALNISRQFIPIEKDSNYINPYILNIKAIYMLHKGADPRIIKDYILWYLEHTNYPDRSGLTGTIYDYTINCKTGQEESTLIYDSVDGYAGIFLVMVYDYYIKTRDARIIQENREKLEDIAYLIAYLQDEDGLIMALPNSKLKYLMDNCEAYGGIRSYNRLSREMGWSENKYYIELENAIKKGILFSLYDKRRGDFYWAIGNDEVFIPDWNRLYPDAFSQVFPLLYGILEEMPQLKEKLGKKFIKRYADKPDLFSLEQKLIFELLENGAIGK